MSDDLTTEQREALIQALGLTYSAKFIPFSQSRSAGDKSPNLNWRITLTKGRQSLTTDYSMGIGHHPVYQDATKRGILALSLDNESIYKESVEKGFWFEGFRKRVLQAPKLLDVLYSLASDADAINYPTFEEWAADIGYDTDSRKGEAVYRACLEIGLKLRAMLGEAGMVTLREATNGY